MQQHITPFSKPEVIRDYVFASRGQLDKTVTLFKKAQKLRSFGPIWILIAFEGYELCAISGVIKEVNGLHGW